MNRLLPLSIILLYMGGIAWFSTRVAELICGVKPGGVALILVLSWSLLGLLSGIVFTILYRSCLNIRHPSLEEDRRLRPLFEELTASSPHRRRYRLYIEESNDYNAFSVLPGVIALSKPLLSLLDDEELKAVMAHELGHLISYDCFFSSFFWGVTGIPYLLCKMARRLFQALSVAIRVIRCGPGLILFFSLIVLLVWKFHDHLAGLYLPGIILLFLFLYPPYHKLFEFLFRYSMRRQEYIQDAYAHSLGYGMSMRNALLKITGDKTVSLSRLQELFSDHPLIHNRILKLEVLEGIRNSE